MEKSKILIFIVIILLMICSISGWDRYEISNNTIVTLVGVDKKGDTLKLFMEYQPPHGKAKSSETSGQSKSQVLIGEGDTFGDAENLYLRKSPDEIYLGSIRALILSDDYAKEGITNYMNRIRGQKEYRKVQNVFTTSTELEKMFDSKSLEIENIGLNIEHLSKQLSANGIDYNATISDTMEALNIKNIGFVTNHIDLINNKIVNTGYSIFEGDKKIGFIPSKDISGVNYFLISKAEDVFVINFEDFTASMHAFLKNKTIKVLYKNGDISFDIKMNLTAHLIYTSGINKVDSDGFKSLGKEVEKKIKQDILDAIETSQKEFECDYLSFYKFFRSKYNSDFETMNWNEKYKEAKFNVDISVEASPSNLVNYDT